MWENCTGVTLISISFTHTIFYLKKGLTKLFALVAVFPQKTSQHRRNCSLHFVPFDLSCIISWEVLYDHIYVVSQLLLVYPTHLFHFDIVSHSITILWNCLLSTIWKTCIKLGNTFGNKCCNKTLFGSPQITNIWLNHNKTCTFLENIA